VDWWAVDRSRGYGEDRIGQVGRVASWGSWSTGAVVKWRGRKARGGAGEGSWGAWTFGGFGCERDVESKGFTVEEEGENAT
jgi:hypothetical protein